MVLFIVGSLAYASDLSKPDTVSSYVRPIIEVLEITYLMWDKLANSLIDTKPHDTKLYKNLNIRILVILNSKFPTHLPPFPPLPSLPTRLCEAFQLRKDLGAVSCSIEYKI